MSQKPVKQNLIQGAMVLTAAMLVVKLFGALFKILVLKQLSGIGAAYFNTAYTLFTPIYSLALAGFPTAVAKMVAEFDAAKRYRDIRKTRRISFLLFFIIGVLGSLILAGCAYPYVKMNAMEGALPATLAIAPSLLFLCMTSVYRGYYEGLRNMKPTAVSQVVEVVVKVGVGLCLTGLVIRIGYAQYDSSGTVFGQVMENGQQAYLQIMSYAAAAAILGVTASTLAGMLYIWLQSRIKGDGITKAQLSASPSPDPAKVMVRSLIKIAVPISLGAFVLNLSTLIDTMTITNAMDHAFSHHFAEIDRIFGGIVPAEHYNEKMFGTFLYGAYSFAFSVFNLIPAFTGILGKSALPNVVSCYTVGDRRGLTRNIESALRMSALISIPAGLGMCVLAKPILTLLYSSQPAEVAISYPAMQVMGISVIFLAIVTPVFSILQAVDRFYLPVKLMLIGSVVKVILNLALTSVPSINLKGAAIGTLICYLLIAFLGIGMMCRVTKVQLHLGSVFGKPLAAGIGCGIGAWAFFNLFQRFLPNSISTLSAVAVAGAIYIIFLFFMKGISQEDIEMLPKGEKIAKTLEKWGLLG